MEKIKKTKAYKLLIERRDKARKEDSRVAVFESYLKKLEDLEEYLDNKYPTISNYFEHYTDHGWAHTTRVLDYMIEIINNTDDLTDMELMIIIFVALLHDIGMAQTEIDGKKLFSDDFIKEQVESYCKNHSIDDRNKACKAVRTELLRLKHGDLAEEVVKELPGFEVREGDKRYFNLFKLKDDTNHISEQDMVNVVAALCKSHMESVSTISERKSVDPMFFFIAGLLRIADYLDMDGSRANVIYQSIHNINDDSATHFTMNQIINTAIEPNCIDPCNDKCPQKEKQESQCGKRSKQIEIKCTYPLDLAPGKKAKIMRMIDDYTSDLEREIQEVIMLFDEKDLGQRLRLLPSVKTTIVLLNPNDEVITTQKLTVDYDAIKTLFFSNQLYKSKLCGLRELVQNAYDACKDFSEHLKKHSELSSQWKPHITITIDTNADTFSLSDNGIGMTKHIITEYFLNIGKSIYNFESLYLCENYHQDHIGHFGLGFFAAFMLSPHVIVETCSPPPNYQTKRIELDINSNFATLTDVSSLTEHGTKVSLKLSEFQDVLCREFKDEECKNSAKFSQAIAEYIMNTFLFDDIEITINCDHEQPIKLVMQKVNIPNGLKLSEKLRNIDAVAKVTKRQLPPIFFAKDTHTLQKIQYDELLSLLSDSKREIPYLDGGSFLIFANNENIVNDFESRANNNAQQRRSLSGDKTKLSESLDITIGKFYHENKDSINEKPSQCRYAMLTYVKKLHEGAALCEKNVPCSRYRIGMLRNNACGLHQLCDQIFMRNVLLPDLHISLPFLNFLYSFDELIANIETYNVYPTLPRDTLTDEHRTELGFAVGRALAELIPNDNNKLISHELYSEWTGNTFLRKG